jgi:hypothetical protein
VKCLPITSRVEAREVFGLPFHRATFNFLLWNLDFSFLTWLISAFYFQFSAFALAAFSISFVVLGSVDHRGEKDGWLERPPSPQDWFYSPQPSPGLRPPSPAPAGEGV